MILRSLVSFAILLVIPSILLSGCTSSYDAIGDVADVNEVEYKSEDEVVTRDNWECTDDCSGHEAGYQWAEDKGITDPDDCGGNSNSFIEGCEAYANEQ
jgi:hypothetical protein